MSIDPSSLLSLLDLVRAEIQGPKARSGRGSGGDGAGTKSVVDGDLAEQTRRSYLTYALSVITARALPDVRDGLKPVQRRILFTMFSDLHLHHEARHRKSAKVVGDVIGKYHPHGDTAVYDAMVRLAQDFAMRARLVDGQGNFGSIDGDGAAAYRYTEARLTKIASELLAELRFDTVNFRPNYDGTGTEPEVLPARYPNVLVNGATGIAVGMATSIPPHNLGEVIKGCLLLIDDPSTSTRKLLRTIKGPDFPTGGQLICDRTSLVQAYEKGKGNFKLAGTYKVVAGARNKSTLIIDSVPYATEKSGIVADIGDLIMARKVPGVVSVQDLSTEKVEIELELTASANPELIMAYLYKHTKLQTTVKLDLTCLVPDAESESGIGPQRLALHEVLNHFLDFRFATIRRRFEHELRKLLERIHILEGFEKIFNDLDKAIRIIRRSEGKADAAQKLMRAFDLDDIQADAILETKLYRLAKLEIEKIRAELEDKRKRARAIEKILASDKKLWAHVRSELEEVAQEFADKRRTKVDDTDLTEEFSAESFIVDEDAYVLVTRDNWIKRQRNLKLETTRIREGDAPLAVVAGSTRECAVLFSNLGSAYTLRIHDIVASTGHGTPVQQLLKFKDGEQVVSAVSTDPRVMEEFGHEKPELGEEYEEPYPHLIAVSHGGMALRFTLWPHKETSTARGRRYGRVRTGDSFVNVLQCYAEDDICVVTAKGRALRVNVMELNLLAGPGLGTALIKLEAGDEVVGAFLSRQKVTLSRSTGGEMTLAGASLKSAARATKGSVIVKRGRVKSVSSPVDVPDLDALSEEA